MERKKIGRHLTFVLPILTFSWMKQQSRYLLLHPNEPKCNRIIQVSKDKKKKRQKETAWFIWNCRPSTKTSVRPEDMCWLPQFQVGPAFHYLRVPLLWMTHCRNLTQIERSNLIFQLKVKLQTKLSSLPRILGTQLKGQSEIFV